MEYPCGMCRGCDQDQARDWSARAFHELAQHATASFVTLTYAPEHLPPDGGLSLDHAQRFLKRLRFHNPGRLIRYFLCGEYGPKTFRPHYHAILFGIDFAPEFYEVGRGTDYAIYQSALLDRIWTHGRTTWSYATPTNVGYVTGYSAKKLTARKRRSYEEPDSIYKRTLPDGRVHLLEPEFQVMSRRPGLGRFYRDNYCDSWRHEGFLTMPGGFKQRVPRYYLEGFRSADPVAYQAFKAERVNRAREAVSLKPKNFRNTHKRRLEARMKSRPRSDA